MTIPWLKKAEPIRITTYLVKRRGCAMTWRKTSFTKTTKQSREGSSFVAISEKHHGDFDKSPLFITLADEPSLYSFSQDKIDTIMSSWLRDLETYN